MNPAKSADFDAKVFLRFPLSRSLNPNRIRSTQDKSTCVLELGYDVDSVVKVAFSETPGRRPRYLVLKGENLNREAKH